jgi:hypothetical protein
MNITRALYGLAIIFVILVITANNAHSEDVELLLGAKSRHIVSKDANEDHNLIAFKYGDFIAGRFDNSYENDSLIAGRSFSNINSNVEYGAIIGLVTGYSKNKGEPLPVIVPYITSTYSYTPIVLLLGDAVVLSFKMDL